MKSLGYKTHNEQGNFEVNWTLEPTLFSKLFKHPSEFSYWTTSEELKNEPYKSSQAGLYYDWFDEEGNRVVCDKTLDKISQVINDFKYS